MSETCARAAEILSSSEAVLVTAANGFSITEGINLFSETDGFVGEFPDIARRYGARSMIQAGMCTMTEEDGWSYWSRLVGSRCESYVPSELMRDLEAVVSGKDVFILTTNGEGHFTSAGFPEGRVYEVEGNWRTMQCASPCHGGIYPALEVMSDIRHALKDGEDIGPLLPRCPRCGGPMMVRMQKDNRFVQDPVAAERFRDFMRMNQGRRMAVLELGVGPRNAYLKRPILDIIASDRNISYITVNRGQAFVPDAIADRSVAVDGDLTESMRRIREAMGA